jgi:hypothetical protein
MLPQKLVEHALVVRAPVANAQAAGVIGPMIPVLAPLPVLEAERGPTRLIVMSTVPSFESARQPIPATLTKPVISLDVVSRSGAGPATLRVLAIAADGGVAVSSGGGVVRSFDARLTPAELAELRGFILEQQRFASIDGPVLARQVGSVTDDGATIVISVATAGGVHRVALEALPDAAALRPGIEPLQRLHAVYQRLMRLVHVTVVGGDAALEAAVVAVNAVLAREHPGAQPLGGEHLLEAHALPDGGVRLSLLRVDAPAAGQPGLRWYAEVQRPASGQPQVRIWRRPA